MAMIDIYTGRVRLAEGLELRPQMSAEDARGTVQASRAGARWIGDATLVCPLPDFAGAGAVATASFWAGRLDTVRLELCSIGERGAEQFEPEAQRERLMRGIGEDFFLTAALRPHAFSFPWGEVGMYADPHTNRCGVAIRYAPADEG